MGDMWDGVFSGESVLIGDDAPFPPHDVKRSTITTSIAKEKFFFMSKSLIY